MTDKTRIDVHQKVTDALIAQIEASPGDWQLPWARPGVAFHIPENVTGRAYNGINIVSLWCAALDKGYPHHLWGTYRQWGERKAQVICRDFRLFLDVSSAEQVRYVPEYEYPSTQSTCDISIRGVPQRHFQPTAPCIFPRHRTRAHTPPTPLGNEQARRRMLRQ